MPGSANEVSAVTHLISQHFLNNLARYELRVTSILSPKGHFTLPFSSLTGKG